MKSIKVVSLFDGISAGQVALQKAGIKYYRYHAYEIDETSIAVAQKNFPSTKQMGCVRDAILYPKADLLIGGSPCQSFSNLISNNLGFKGKSNLFFEYVRALDQIQPRYFFLENVVMKKEWADVITENMGVEPIIIDSGDFSVQSRNRMYWTNIPIVGITVKNTNVLGDILQNTVEQKYFYEQPHEYHGGDKVVCATLDIKGHEFIKRVNSPNYKVQTLTGVSGGNQHKKVLVNGRVRKLTPTEYERCMGFPDGYTSGHSDTKRYNMLGNSWEINTITHIFKSLKEQR